MDRFFPKVAFTKDPSPLWFFFPKFHGFPSTHVDPYRAAANHEAANQHKPHSFGKKHIYNIIQQFRWDPKPLDSDTTWNPSASIIVLSSKVLRYLQKHLQRSTKGSLCSPFGSCFWLGCGIGRRRSFCLCLCFGLALGPSFWSSFGHRDGTSTGF